MFGQKLSRMIGVQRRVTAVRADKRIGPGERAAHAAPLLISQVGGRPGPHARPAALGARRILRSDAIHSGYPFTFIIYSDIPE